MELVELALGLWALYMFHVALGRGTCMAFQNFEIKFIDSICQGYVQKQKVFQNKKNFAKKARESYINKTD